MAAAPTRAGAAVLMGIAPPEELEEPPLPPEPPLLDAPLAPLAPMNQNCQRVL